MEEDASRADGDPSLAPWRAPLYRLCTATYALASTGGIMLCVVARDSRDFFAGFAILCSGAAVWCLSPLVLRRGRARFANRGAPPDLLDGDSSEESATGGAAEPADAAPQPALRPPSPPAYAEVVSWGGAGAIGAAA